MYKRVIIGPGLLFSLVACSAAQSPSNPVSEMVPGMERGRKKYNLSTFVTGYWSPV